MNTAKHPRPIRPKLSEPERTDMIVNEMLLLRAFPNHDQAEEFRRNIAYAKAKLPALHAHAEMLVREKMAAEDHLLEHPEDCRRCAGTGRFLYQGRYRFCGCPAGDRAAKTEVLPEPEPARLEVVPKPLNARQQLQQLRSLFDPEAE